MINNELVNIIQTDGIEKSGSGKGELGSICISRKCTSHFKENHQGLYYLGVQERRKDFEEPQSSGARDIRAFNSFNWWGG